MVERIALQSEGPVASGQAYVTKETFLEFYFNEKTETTAFALIKDQKRIWGIDRDNARGWHLHPLENPRNHIKIKALSVSEIVEYLRMALKQDR